MHTPYTHDFLGAFIIAQCGAALMLTALLLFWRVTTLSRILLLGAAWLAAVAVLVGPTGATLGYKPGPDVLRHVLVVSATLATFGAVAMLRPWVAVLALAGQLPLWKVTGFLKESECELSALHLIWIGLIVGLLCRPPRDAAVRPRVPSEETEGSYRLHDLAVFTLATVLAALVSVYVMDRRDGSADEWAYTFQAATFAKGHVYSIAPRCESYLDTYYVFESMGRQFSQYTPGWPFFITPFVWVRAVWLSGPFSMGVMAWGMARLGRSAMRWTAGGEITPRVIRAAGTWAAVLAMLGTTILVNGGSRYSHVFVVGLFAWALEALLVVSTPGLSSKRQLRWGLVLGSMVALGLASRPADGAFIAFGVGLVFLYSVARRRVGWRAFVWTAASFALWSALVLVILRLQLGKWFTTGYSLLAVNYPWQTIKYSWPEPNQWRYGVPLATGSYCWWPCSLPLGLAGLATLRGRSRGLVVAIALTCLPYQAYLTSLEFGRGWDWGYGPRYSMLLLVPMATGGAVALAQLTVAARSHALGGRSPLARGAPLALAVLGVAATWVRLVPLLWPMVYEHTHQHGALQRAIEEAHLKNALVLAAEGTTGFSDLDLATNLPLDLYPDQDVIIAIDRQTPREAVTCLRSAFPGRKFYSASGYADIHITPF